MSAKQFEHFLNFQRQFAGLRRAASRPAKSSRRAGRVHAAAVATAKDWLAGAARAR